MLSPFSLSLISGTLLLLTLGACQMVTPSAVPAEETGMNTGMNTDMDACRCQRDITPRLARTYSD